MQPDYYDKQFQSMQGDERNVLDHRFYRHFLPFAKTRTQVALEMLGSDKFENVAEFGCGSCQIASHKIDQFGRYTGFDISPYQVSLAPESVRSHPKVSLVQQDLNQPVPCPDGAFDLVISLSVIQYVFDPVKFIREIRRVLKKGGTLLLQTENIAFALRRLQLCLGQLPTYNSAPGWQGGYLHHFTFPTLKKLMADEGFQLQRFRCSGLFPALRIWWPNFLAPDMLFLCHKL